MPRLEMIIYDCFSRDIILQRNARWNVKDAEYTMSRSTLSAVWPDIRNGKYSWKVFSSKTLKEWAYFKATTTPDFTKFINSAQEVLAYGETTVVTKENAMLLQFVDDTLKMTNTIRFNFTLMYHISEFCGAQLNSWHLHDILNF